MATPASDWKLNSGSGSIRLSLNSQARYNLNASTSSGSVNVSSPIVMQTGLDKRHILGSVNGGGPTVRISTGSGDVTVH